jgi:hypothetical protein
MAAHRETELCLTLSSKCRSFHLSGEISSFEVANPKRCLV